MSVKTAKTAKTPKTAATAAAPSQAAPARKAQYKPASRPSANGKGAGALTHESVADDIAAFRKAGGKIEVLGHTPFRPAAPSRSSAKPATPAPAAAASKAAG